MIYAVYVSLTRSSFQLDFISGIIQQYYYSLHLRQIIVKYFYRVLIVFKYPFLHFPSRSIDYHVHFSTVI